MTKRKGISQKIRFEIFKRDSFTCQYCGRSAPDVILEVDHINPVANGGDNEIMNLITSCKECNGGKGKRELSDSDLLKKQKEQLDELNERRNQLELMLQWKEGLQTLADEQVSAIEDLLKGSTGFGFNDHGKLSCKKEIKKFGFDEVYKSAEISIEQYYDGTDESVTKTFNYIGRICNMRKKQAKNPNIKYHNYIKKVCENRFSYINRIDFSYYMEKLVNDEESFEFVKFIACDSRNWTEFKQRCESVILEEGATDAEQDY